jgi:hypothetical protein
MRIFWFVVFTMIVPFICYFTGKYFIGDYFLSGWVAGGTSVYFAIMALDNNF